MAESIAELTNAPAELDWQGKKYRVTELELVDIGEFVKWAKQMAVVEADFNSLEMTQKLRDEMITAVTRDINSGYYEPGARGFCEKLSSPGGQAKILQLGLKKFHPEITFSDCKKMVLGGMLGMVFKMGYEPFGGSDDPNSKKTAGQAAQEKPLPL